MTRIRDVVIGVAGRIVKYAILAKSTATGHACAVESPEREADEPDGQEPARRLQHFGFRSVPPVGSECAVVRSRGGASNAIIVATEHLGYGPKDLESGEAALFSIAHGGSTVCYVKMEKDGDIIVVPAANKKIKLGDSVDANLDPIVLFTQLKAEFDAFVTFYNNHFHPVLGANTDIVPIPNQASPLTTAVQAANVVGKKS